MTRERSTHIAIADRLRLEARAGWFWSHVPAGELRTKKTAALLQRMGLKPGMSDFLLIDELGSHYWLELKSSNGALSDEQINFIGMLRRRGVNCAIARSYVEAIKTLQTWGVL